MSNFLNFFPLVFKEQDTNFSPKLYLTLSFLRESRNPNPYHSNIFALPIISSLTSFFFYLLFVFDVGFFFFFFSSTTLLLPAHLLPPSCTHAH